MTRAMRGFWAVCCALAAKDVSAAVKTAAITTARTFIRAVIGFLSFLVGDGLCAVAD